MESCKPSKWQLRLEVKPREVELGDGLYLASPNPPHHNVSPGPSVASSAIFLEAK